MGKGIDGKDASSLKEAGNKAFASGDLVEAHTLYTEALDCSGDSSAQVINFRATVLSNRAMVLFKQGKALECVIDCTNALELDPGRVKAYFRRALAREQMGEDADALRDAKRALELDPGNKEAVKAARRIKDKVAKAAKLNTPVVQALKALREAAEKVRKHTQDAPTAEIQAPAGKDAVAGKEQRVEAAASFSEEDMAQSKVMLALGALVSSEQAAGMQLLREGCMAPLSVCMKAASTFPKTAKEALRALGAAAQHRGFGLVLLKTQGVELLSDLADILVEEGARSGVGDGSPVAEAVLSASVHLLQWDEPAVVDRLDELPEVNREQVEEAGKELADAAVKVLAQGLRLPNQEVFDMALEAVVRWCSPRSDDEPKASDDGSLPAKEAYEKRQKAHRRRVRLSLWVRDKGLALLSSSAVVW